MAFIAMIEFLHKRIAQDALTLAVDKDYLQSLVFEIGIHYFAKFVDLQVEHVG